MLFPESQILFNWFRIMEADKHQLVTFVMSLNSSIQDLISNPLRSLGGDSCVLDDDNRSRSALIALWICLC